MRRPFLPIVAAVAAAGLFAAGLALAASGTSSSTKLSAKLMPHNERPVPKGAAGATGSFTGTLTGSTLVWRLTFSHLTGKATAAHIHMGKAGVAGPVVVPLCGPCVSGAHGRAKLTATVRRAVLSGTAYVNVHTVKNPGGEIRGQMTGGNLTPAPAPSTTSTAATTTTGGYGGGYG
jgi:hypothetical protein